MFFSSNNNFLSFFTHIYLPQGFSIHTYQDIGVIIQKKNYEKNSPFSSSCYF